MNENELKTNTIEDVQANAEKSVDFANKHSNGGMSQSNATIFAAVIGGVVAILTTLLGAIAAPIIAMKMADWPERKKANAIPELDKWKNETDPKKKAKAKEKLIKKYGINPDELPKEEA